MSKVRYWIGALVVVASVGYLAISAADQNMVTYLTIPEVKANPARSAGNGVRIVGNVGEGSIATPAPREVWFTVVGEGDTLRACYRGVVPDTFKDHAEVVLEGRMNDRGEFMASTLLAKCPSKYDPETHEMRD